MPLPRILLFFLVATHRCCYGCPEYCHCSDGDLVVDCSNLNLTTIPDLQLNITSLDLSHNDIGELVAEAFSGLASLTTLDLSFNQISSVDDLAFVSLTSLSNLIITNNRLTELNAIFKPLSNLVFLDASHNKITSVAESAFTTSYYLTQLKLSNNSIDWLVFKAVDQIQSLTILNLSENPLQYVPYLSMSSLFSLQFLHLAKCQITTLDSNAFLGLNALSQLDISGNLVTNVNRETFQTLGKMDEIDISGNPLSCDCDTKKFQDLISTKEIRMTHPASCYYDNDVFDVANGDLDFLCNGEGPVSPSLGCFNLSLSLAYERVSGEEVNILWKVSNQEIESSYKLSHREFGNIESISEMLNANCSSTKLPLQSTGSYVTCLRHNECGVEECVDITKSDSATLSTDDVILIAGVCGGSLLILLIVLIVVLIVRKKPKHEKQKTKNDVNHNVASPPRVSTVSSRVMLPDNPYEAIPIERMTFHNHGYVVSDSEDEYCPSYRTRSPAIRITTDSGLSLTDEYLTPVTKTPKLSYGFFPQQASCPNLQDVEPRNEYHKYEEPKDLTSPSDRPSSSESRVRVFNRKFRTMGPNDGRIALNIPQTHSWGQNGLFKSHSSEMLSPQHRPLPRTP